MSDKMPDREKVIKRLEEVIAEAVYPDRPRGFMMPLELAERVLAALKVQESPTNAQISSAIECLLHPQDADDSDMAKAIDTAICAMKSLKAQEPVEPQEKREGDYKNLYCGACGRGIVGYVGHLTGKHLKTSDYCNKCGRDVKWE